MLDAETYDAYLVPAVFEPWSRELIKRAQVWKGDRVLDVACGTGIVAARIAGTGAAVTAIDSSPERIAQAKKRAADEGVGVKWLEGSAEALPFRAPAFDLVTCQQGLQFVGDRALACREMRRVIAPGGRAVIACWTPIAEQGGYKILDDVATKHFGAGFILPFSFGGDAAVMTKVLTDAKFFAVAVETVTRQVKIPDPRRFATVTLTDLGNGADPTAAIAEAMPLLESFVEDGQLAFPMKALIGVGRVKT